MILHWMTQTRLHTYQCLTTSCPHIDVKIYVDRYLAWLYSICWHFSPVWACLLVKVRQAHNYVPYG